MAHNISLWRLRNLAGARYAPGAFIAALIGALHFRGQSAGRTARLPAYWRTQRMRAIQATSPLGTLRLEGPPPIDLSSIF